MVAGPLVVSTRSFGTGDIDLVGRLTEAGCRVVRIAHDHDLDTVADALADAEGWIAGVAPVTVDHFRAAPRLRILARYGVGTDAVDLVAAATSGVVVTNTPGANAGAVAEHALALTLAALRGVVAGDRAWRSGAWTAQRGREISALTVGVVGAGRIGQGYAARVRALGARVVAHDPFLTTAPDLPLVTLGELLSTSNVPEPACGGGNRGHHRSRPRPGSSGSCHRERSSRRPRRRGRRRCRVAVRETRGIRRRHPAG